MQGMEIVKLMGLLSLTWLFVEGAKPPQFLKSFLGIGNEQNPKDLTRLIFQALLNCCLCTGFWVGLIAYQNLNMAGIFSISVEAFSRIIKKYWV
jgi:hypothetical protein